ncbi:MAG: hypothetical protein ACJ786_19635 [Catenulispora sp.]
MSAPVGPAAWAVVAAEGDPSRAEWSRAAQAAGVAAPRFVAWASVLAGEAGFRPGEYVFFERLQGWQPSNPVGGQRARYREFEAAVRRLDATAAKDGALPVTAPETALLALDRNDRDAFLRERGIPVLEPSDPMKAGTNIMQPRFAAADDWLVDRSQTTLYPHFTRSGVEVRRGSAESSATGLDIRDMAEILEPDGIHAVARLHRVYLGGAFYDLRFGLVDGKVTHAAGVVRERITAREWYGGRRRELEAFLDRFGDARWSKVVALAERTATLFPGIRSLGVDVALDNFEAEYVFDVDPFGAQLPGLMGRPGTIGDGLSVRAAVLRSLPPAD